MQTDVVIQRIIAYIIDVLIVFGLALVLGIVLAAAGLDVFDIETNNDDSGFRAEFGLANSWTWIWNGMFLLYKSGLETVYGQTLGKRLLKIRVIKAVTFSPVGWQDAIVRNLILLTPFILLSDTNYGILELIGLIWLVAGTVSMIRSRERQRLGDRAANTIVVRATGEVPQSATSYAAASPLVAAPVGLDAESWVVCAHCGSQFQGKQALRGIWQGKSYPTCPNCGAPIDP